MTMWHLFRNLGRSRLGIEAADPGLLAAAAAASADELTLLADHEDPQVRLLVARNAAAPADALVMLALGDEAPELKAAVAAHPNTPAWLLADLADEESREVRLAVAGNPNAPEEALAMLAGDHDERVRTVADELLGGFSAQALYELAADFDADVRSAVAGSHAVSAELLAELACDFDPEVRAAAAGNPNTPAEILARLEDDAASAPAGEERR